MYYIYMLRCKDNSIYTGICTDLDKRLEEHFTRNEKCAKYTKTKIAIKLECAWNTDLRTDACKLEYWIKRLNKAQKEELIKNKELSNSLFKDKLSIEKYNIER